MKKAGMYELYSWKSCAANNNDNTNNTTYNTNISKGRYLVTIFTNDYATESDWGDISLLSANGATLYPLLYSRGRYQSSKFALYFVIVTSTTNSFIIHCWSTTSRSVNVLVGFLKTRWD